jgi:hypothetical protein
VDFIRLIRSLEELLYEGMTRLVLYPRTMVRIVAHPEAATRYSEDEQKDDAADTLWLYGVVLGAGLVALILSDNFEWRV